MWYSWFCPEGSINGQNSTFFGFHFVPRDLDSRRHKGSRLAAQGTLTRGTRDLDSRRHWTSTQINGAASRGPLRCESRSLVPPRVEVPGDKMKTEKCWVLGVYRPLWPKSPHYYPKYEIWMIEKIVNNPFKVWKWWNSAFHHWHILIWRYLKNQFSLSKIFFWSKLG